MITGRSPIPAINVRDSIVSDLFRGVAIADHDTIAWNIPNPRDTFDLHRKDEAFQAAMLSWVARGNVPPGIREFGPSSVKLARILLGYCICVAINTGHDGTHPSVKLARKVASMHIRNRRKHLREWYKANPDRKPV